MINQSKHNRIYEETGIEPRMWNDLDMRLAETQIVLTNLKIQNQSKLPHYPESQLWDMLPKRIGQSFLIISAGVVYKDYSHPSVESNSPEHFVPLDNGLHTALLDMVIWCIENNYIKEEQK